MSRRAKRAVLAVCGSCVLVGLGAPIALALTDKDDKISPANKAITASLKTGTKSTFTATVDVETIGATPVTISCTTSSTGTKTPMKGLGPTTLTNPTFKHCTDNLTGTDTSTTSSKNGPWTITFVDAASDETGEKSGDALKIKIPKAGATVTSSDLPGCTITVAPSGPANVSATYNDAGTAKFKAAGVPYAASGSCATSSGTARFSGTYIVKPAIHDGS